MKLRCPNVVWAPVLHRPIITDSSSSLLSLQSCFLSSFIRILPTAIKLADLFQPPVSVIVPSPDRRVRDLPTPPLVRELRFNSALHLHLQNAASPCHSIYLFLLPTTGVLFAPFAEPSVYEHATTGTSWAIAHASPLGSEQPPTSHHGFWYAANPRATTT